MMEQSSGAGNPQPSTLTVKVAWLAGVIDGEGYLGVNVIERKDRHRLQVAPRMTIVNTNRDLVDEVADVLTQMKVGHIIKACKLRKGWSQRWDITVWGYKRVARLLPWVRDLLIAKRWQAQLLDAFVNYRLGQWQQSNGGRRAGYDGLEIEVWDTLKALNQGEGSETVRVASLRLMERMIQSGLHSDVERTAEMTVPA